MVRISIKKKRLTGCLHFRTYIGGRTTLLDVAKSAVETFVKIRQRSMDSRIDRYMLLTFEETPNNIKAGEWNRRTCSI
jgi:hypothetical protein